MDTNDFLLIFILLVGMVWINWNIIKKDFFSLRHSSKPSDTNSISERHPVEVRKELPLQT